MAKEPQGEVMGLEVPRLRCSWSKASCRAAGRGLNQMYVCTCGQQTSVRLFYRAGMAFLKVGVIPGVTLLAGRDTHTVFTSAFQLQLPCCCVSAVW